MDHARNSSDSKSRSEVCFRFASVVLCSCRDPRRLLSFLRSLWSWLHPRSKFLAKRWAAMASKRGEIQAGDFEENR